MFFVLVRSSINDYDFFFFFAIIVLIVIDCGVYFLKIPQNTSVSLPASLLA